MSTWPCIRVSVSFSFPVPEPRSVVVWTCDEGWTGGRVGDTSNHIVMSCQSKVNVQYRLYNNHIFLNIETTNDRCTADRSTHTKKVRWEINIGNLIFLFCPPPRLPDPISLLHESDWETAWLSMKTFLHWYSPSESSFCLSAFLESQQHKLTVFSSGNNTEKYHIEAVSNTRPIFRCFCWISFFP